ncbi:MAG: ATP-grasp domain-containing protein [Candidatus Omnitrophica bacterium]|nr:ATP-grasp domain-containing protein [Candidatus Omnitrophota bacterium]
MDISEETRASGVRTIAIVCNLKKAGSDSDQYEEYDEIETVEALRTEMEGMGFAVLVIEQDAGLVDTLRESRPDFVFNIAEGIGSSRTRESQVPCILESLHIPYSGSDPLSLAVTLDKYLTNRLLKTFDVPVPHLFVVKELKELERISFTPTKDKLLLVKPRWEGSSKGIFSDSLVSDMSALSERVARILDDYRQPAVVEEFMEGNEITVAVCGNAAPRVLGMMKIVPRGDKIRKQFIYSIEVKRDWRNQVEYIPSSLIPSLIREQVRKHALRAFSALELRDIARIDFRLDSKKIPRVIDINPLPGLSPHYSDLPILYTSQGGSYSELIRTIVYEALKRYDLGMPSVA